MEVEVGTFEVEQAYFDAVLFDARQNWLARDPSHHREVPALWRDQVSVNMAAFDREADKHQRML